MKAEEISPKKRRTNQTSIAMERRNMLAAATGLAGIVLRAEIVVDAADVPVAGDVIVGAVGAVDVPVAVAAVVIADAAGRVGADTRTSATDFTDKS